MLEVKGSGISIPRFQAVVNHTIKDALSFITASSYEFA